ncbi:diacylglycerol/lipid kinase family protein [Demequina muriae]|uniref:Diacylglycerol kinase family lipid kinase n=1 Tax=Demequina muriae TaxID=3051664 RepID=A0ABT8GKE5_9MICO|nr:diacylglycerol kinase family protein [Demequina sp. EGI L300058]MDN4481714.1 diacylglycerol kinase family lipid kinase [Demequina sp. EGI L300058]
MSTIGVITNPTAGSGRGASSSAETLALLAARGHRVRDLSMGSWAASLDHARERHRDLDALVVVGGDGMAHLGIQACAETRLPLGIVAAGSGNDAALSLGLPVHDIPAAVAAIERGLEGDVVRVDLGRIDGESVAERKRRRYFAAVLSAGIDAAIAAYANRLSFPRGPLKYKVATLRELPRFKPYGVSLEVDGERWEQRCTLVAVANGPVFGGGLVISPESSHVDGLLELVLAEPMRPLAIARVFPRLNDGSHLSDPRVRVVQARRVRIGPAETGAPLPPAFADGELIGPAPLDVRVVPGALRVLGGKADSLKA